MNVTELSRDELIELKEYYMYELADEGEIDWHSWGEIAAADEIIPDETVFEHYAAICFTEDDFFCNLHNERDE